MVERGDGSEDIEVEMFEQHAVQDMIASGSINHALTVTVFYFNGHI